MIGINEIVTVNEGDYIVREERGATYVLPKVVFEIIHEKVRDVF